MAAMAQAEFRSSDALFWSRLRKRELGWCGLSLLFLLWATGFSVLAQDETVTLDVSIEGDGTVTSSPPGIGCPTECAATFTLGTEITLTASAAAGAEFIRWDGDDCAEQPSECTFDIGENSIVKAVFSEGSSETFALVLAKTGAGVGRVVSTPQGISCGATCAFSFAKDTQVKLAAAPDENSTFAGWSGDCTGTITTCVLTLNEDKAVTATFEPKIVKYALKVIRSGSARGLVTSVPAGLTCGSTCTVTLDESTVITLTATPETGHGFTGWSGDCTGTSASCTLTMNADKAVTATFNPIADLALTQTDSPDPATTATNITYKIIITNNGPGTASNVTLSDPLPTGVNLVSAQSTQGKCIDVGLVRCSIGNLRANASVTVTIVVTPLREGSLTNTATVNSNVSDPNPNNNSATATTSVVSTCGNLVASVKPASVTYNPTPTRSVRRNIALTIANRSHAAHQVTAIVPQEGEPFTIVSVSPQLPMTIRRGAAQRFIVLTQRAAGLGSATATKPFFKITLNCGVLTSASIIALPIPSRFALALTESEARSVHFQLFTLDGRRILDFVSDRQTVKNGRYFNGQRLPNGIYLYVLSEQQRVEVRKLVIVR
jgi:uncharacterized repeat protein (TIGR01451 family)/uncharacterized repeat protein (TIGR02543 family)